jgi:TonB family protein
VLAASSGAAGQEVVKPIKSLDDIPRPLTLPRAASPSVQGPKLTSANRIRYGLERFAPEVDLFFEQSGRTQITVIVGTDGRVNECRIRRSSGYAELDRSACYVMERFGRFDPALDASGQPVRGEFNQTLGWDAAGDEVFWADTLEFPYPPAALAAGAEGEVRISFKVGPAGRASDCEVVESSGSNVLDAATCENVLRLRGSARGPEIATAIQLIPLERVVTWELPDEDDREE